jgi:hypothetical protein
MRWRWRRRAPNGAAAIRAEKEAEQRATKRATPMVEKLADRVAALPPDEFADRVARAFRRRPA